MSVSAYVRTNYQNGTTPALNQANLNKIEQALYDYHLYMENSAQSDVGIIFYFAMSSVPANWLKCDGSAVSRATYSALFNVIGTTFGSGDGSTTFNLPDLRGCFIRGYDDARSYDPGRTFGSYQADSIKQHSHTYTDDTCGSTGQDKSGGLDFRSDYGVSSATRSTQYTGTESRPKNVALIACIKYR